MSRQDRNKSFLDSIFGRPNKKEGGRGGGGYKPRPHSEGDMNEHERYLEEEKFIEELDEKTINDKLEELLNEMNLSDEKKQPLRSMTLENKQKMLISKARQIRTNFEKPGDFVRYLYIADLSFNKLYTCVESLRIALTGNPLSWVREFGAEGLKAVLHTLNRCYTSPHYDKIQVECLKCIKAVMNNTIGLAEVFKQNEALTMVARSVDTSNPMVMLEAVRILAAACLVPPDGHSKVLEAISMNGEFKDAERFAPIVQGLQINNEQLKVVCLQFINAIITTPDEVDFKIHLRNEFMRNGLYDLMDGLEKDASEDLKVQLKVFNDHKEEDFDEFSSRFDNLRLDFDDVNECFEVVKNITLDTPSEPYLLSILQHLLFIRDDHFIRNAYFKLVEECVSQIVLHRNGFDPDFRGRHFQFDIESVIDSLVEKSKNEDEERIKGLLKQIEELSGKLQEKEAELTLAQKSIAEYQTSGVKPTGPSIAGKLGLPVGNVPPPPPPLPGGGGPPPPPPFPSGGGPPPPPPPPPPGEGGPPRPPPPPGMGPLPPPPPGGMGPPPPKLPEALPFGLKPKKKWNVEGIKRANWKTIVPQKLNEKSFWVQVQEEKLASPDILESLTAQFSSKPAPKKNEDVIDNKGGTLKKVKSLKVLDAKAAQNLSILLGGSLKHLSYQEIKKYILSCDDTVLTDNILESLIQYLPPPDQLKRLTELKVDYSELTEAEQFAHTLGEIKRLLPRLRSLKFKLHHPEMVQDIKPNIIDGAAACEEVKKSKKLSKILELILMIGNFMNSGSRNGQAFAFEISYLPKLASTKDLENKRTLMHFLVETIERKFPELLTFGDELMHVERAARVSVDQISKSLRIMDSNIKNLETDLANNKVPLDDSDKFSEVMGSFAKQAKKECAVLKNMFQNMESLYNDLAEYYAFDKQKYTLEEFFTDLKAFMDSFYQAHKENVVQRETEEKARRAKEAREKAEAERAERSARKKALVDMNPAQTQEGVMDSLLEALQTGSAFSRDQRRKRAGPRPTGAERRAQLSRSRSRSGLVGREITASEIMGSA